MTNWFKVVLGVLLWLAVSGQSAWAQSAPDRQVDDRVQCLCERLNRQRDRFNRLQDQAVPLFLQPGKQARQEAAVLNCMARLSYGKMLLNSINTAFYFDEDQDLEAAVLQLALAEQGQAMLIFNCTPEVVYQVTLDEIERQCDEVEESLEQAEDFLGSAQDV